MKKMIISVIVCFAMVLGAFLIYACAYDLATFFHCHYKVFDVLAAALFMGAIIPSALFEEGRKEYVNTRDDVQA
jgi:hypothetical protein